jgi:hypothetical protein
MGLAFAAIGLMMTAVVLYNAAHADPLTADHLIGAPATLIFVFVGILMALPSEQVKWRSFLATLVVGCFALTFDWVAFGPGERKFSGSVMGFGFIPGEFPGRALFGVFAAVLDICAIGMWVSLCRRALGLPSHSPLIEQKS